MKNRPARVRELIQRELGAIIMREMNFTVLVTVQAVDLTADFKHCHVHIGVLGSEREQRDAIHALGERRPQLQHELSKRVILKYTPAIHFHLDHSVERGTKVMEIMRQIDEITPPSAEETDEDAPMSVRAAKDAVDMETEETQQEEAARHQVEEDGADDEQDALFEETFTPGGDEEKSAPKESDRGSRNAKLRAAHESDDVNE